MESAELLKLTCDIVGAHVSANKVETAELPALLRQVHSTLGSLAKRAAEPIRPTPATSIQASLADPEYILSMIDGRRYRSLKRHIEHHGYTVESYRRAFSLPADYPLTAPAYSERRRQLAHTSGLGRRDRKAKG